MSLISNRTIFDLLLPIDRLKNIDLTISLPESLSDGTRIGRSTAISRHFVYFFISIWKKKIESHDKLFEFLHPFDRLIFYYFKSFCSFRSLVYGNKKTRWRKTDQSFVGICSWCWIYYVYKRMSDTGRLLLRELQ